MKKIIFIAGLLFSIAGSYAQDNIISLKNIVTGRGSEVPTLLLTNKDTSWTISSLTSSRYASVKSGGSFNGPGSSGGRLVKFKFLKDNRFEFLLYVQSTNNGTFLENWTQVTGTVGFSKVAKGQQVFVTSAEKGFYRTVKNGMVTTRAIPGEELKNQHSNTYLWEWASFEEDPKNDYLLVVDLDEHPTADITQRATINPAWISKFHIPKRKIKFAD